MVHKIKRFFVLIGVLLFVVAAHALAQQATTGLPAPQLYGSGTPNAAGLACTSNSSYMGLMYIQTDATNGNVWLCMNAGAGWGWNQIVTPVKGTAVTDSFPTASYLLGGCSAVKTVTITGAQVGVNSAIASPIYASAPSGNPGLFNVQAWVSAANTVSVQGCAIGTFSSVPAWTANVQLN